MLRGRHADRYLEKVAAQSIGEANAPTPTDDDPFPLLRMGAGDAILIGSSTYDNFSNLAHRFIEKVANCSTPRPRRDGSEARSPESGRAGPTAHSRATMNELIGRDALAEGAATLIDNHNDWKHTLAIDDAAFLRLFEKYSAQIVR